MGRLSKADELLRTCCKLGRQWSIVVHTLSTTIYSAPVLPRLHLEANIYQRLVKILFWIDVVFLFSFFLSHSHSFLFAASSFHFKSQLWRWMCWHVAQDKLPLPQPPLKLSSPICYLAEGCDMYILFSPGRKHSIDCFRKTT